MSTCSEARTLVDALQEHARTRACDVAFTFLTSGTSGPLAVTYGDLNTRAYALASALRARGLCGQPVLVVCAEGVEYVTALLGCMYAGAIAVPAYPPTRTSLARALPRLRDICADCGATAAITTAEVRSLWLEAVQSVDQVAQSFAFERLDLLVVGAETTSGADAGKLPEVAPSSPALLQYTSGSTSTPKGVLLTHEQIVANQQMLSASCNLSSRDVVLSWLPPFHDMGLMGGIFQPLFAGARGVLMSTEAFIRKPRRWLQAAGTERATLLIGPNFAFDLCVRRVGGEARTGLDLSSVRAVYNGAEPIRPDTLERFVAAFGPHGFRPEAFYPCYGMAEATLIISGGDVLAPPVVRNYSAEALERNDAESAPAVEGNTRHLVGCGRALLDERILIVEPDTTRPLPDRRIGEIWVQSRSVATGYWNRPEETEQTFRAFTADGEGPFLRTGDLGFFDDGELFITGRLKDLIILRGLNHYPQDIERTVQGVAEALTADAGAAFAVDGVVGGSGDGGEQLVVVQELDKRSGPDADALLAQIPEAIRAAHDITPVEVVLIKRGSMLKTSSGKVQRRATKQAYLSGDLQVIARWHVASSNASEVSRAHDAKDAVSTAQSALRTVAKTHTQPFDPRRAQEIADWLRAYVARRLERPADAIDPDEPLARYGVDSLLAAELTEALEEWLGLTLPSTVSYDNPTIASLSRALARWGTNEAATRPAPRERPAPSPARTDDPIAIVGMACRFPGADDLKAFWTLLRHGVDAITEVPSDRWDVEALYDRVPGKPGKMCSKWGGFVFGIDQFDAGFFGISPREAARIDPQQRLFLEVAWEALEDAGQSPAALAGSRTGVFAGVCTSDYAMLYSRDLRLIDADYGTGNAPSLVANRLSYLLDLKGPSETIDSACSSALVAVQHACRSLHELESEIAIVGGVNAVLAPESSVYFSQVRALAKDGRCKTFDREADGFVRSEGAGVLVLKRLSRAIADGDRVHALIAGSAVNHDGRSNGILAPNGLAQQDVIRRALTAAAVSADEIDYVEAHGVGTPVADAVEMHALGAVLADAPRSAPLRVGSAKTNVGHLEAASGMVGLIKVALSLSHEEIPPHLHLNDVHPDIGIESLPIEIPVVPVAWRRGSRPRFAGVSTFGFGGTNAHVVVREAPLAARATPASDRPRHVLPLSAKDRTALRHLALRTVQRLSTARDDELPDIAFTAGSGRAHFGYRLAVTGCTVNEVRKQLDDFARELPAPDAHYGHLKPGARALIGLVFDDTVPQAGALRAIAAQCAPLRQAIEACDHWVRAELEQPPSALLCQEPTAAAASLLERPSHAHAALVSMQYALHSLLAAWGVEPIAVYGAGAGEYAAAAATGVMSWQEAVVLAARRGRVREGLVSGAAQSVTVRAFKAELAAIDYLAPGVPFVSASLGRAFTLDEVPDDAHWLQHVYHEPHADDGRDALLAEGCALHVELGAAVGRDAWRSLLDVVARLYAAGVPIDWQAFDAPYPRNKVSLPNYPFQRQRYWLDFPAHATEGTAPQTQPPPSRMVERPSSHPLISRVRVHVPAESGFTQKGTSATVPDPLALPLAQNGRLTGGTSDN